MKKFLLFALVCLQTIATNAAKNEVVISGTITNALADSISFNYLSFEDNWLESKEILLYAPLDKQGQFKITLPVYYEHTRVVIDNGKASSEIYIDPGYNLQMTADGADLKNTITYKGTGAAVANFMAKYVAVVGHSIRFHQQSKKININTPDDYIKALDSLVQIQLNFLKENDKGLPTSFIKYWKADYTYHKYKMMLAYPHFHEFAKANSYDIDSVPWVNYIVATQVPAVFNDDYMPLLSYRNYMTGYYSMQLTADKNLNNTIIPDVAKRAAELNDKNLPPYSKEYIFAREISTRVEYRTVHKSDSLFNIYNKKFGTNKYTATLKKRIEQKRGVSVGKPAKDFKVYDKDGNEVNLSDLKGKVVYIDFWASWCGPCRMEFPYAKKIKEHFKDEDVVFVYISLDDNEQYWKNAIEKYGIAGLHARVGDNDSQVAKDYGVKGVPAYFLIDKEGKFAAEQTPRPSHGESLIKKIEKLL